MHKIKDLSQLDLSNFVQQGDLVLWGQGHAEPVPLTQKLMQERSKIGHFQVFLGINYYATCKAEYTDYIHFLGYCGAGNQSLTKANLLDVFPVHYSEFPRYIEQKILNVDVVFIQVSGPNIYGQYSYSLAQDYLKSAIKHARIVIAEVNQQAPWIYSEYYLTEDDFDVIYYSDRPIEDINTSQPNEVNQIIAKNSASLIEDGSTLQIGIGAIPDAVLDVLDTHQNLGIHSGIITNGVIDLMQKGNINNRFKNIDTGKTITGLISVSQSAHSFINQNKNIELKATEYTHDHLILSQIEKFTAINSAIEIDLTGQINSEIANGIYVGAVGGALDFIRAGNQSKAGKSIIALPSSGKGFSRIVHQINGPVSTPRSDANIIVTEYGIADLRGLSIAKRIKKMIEISHPDYQEELARQAYQLNKF